MKIVFISPRFFPDIGGVEKHALEVAKKLSKSHEVTVITEGEKSKKEKTNGIKIIRIFFGKKDWFKKFVIWWKILNHRKLIEKADIVHCHDVFFWYLPLRIIYPNKKVFITFHGYEGTYPPTLKAIFIRKLSNKLSSGNIAIGKYIEKWYGTRPNAVVYGAVNKVKNSNFKVQNSKLKILFIGRIEKDTGVKTYSEVLKQLKNYEFEACGDGSKRSELEKYGKVHGFVKNIDKYINKSDIIFASSYLSILAAIKLRKPVFSVFENPMKGDYLKMAPFAKWIYIAGSSKILIKKIKTVMRNNRLREKNVNLALDHKVASSSVKQNLAYNWVKDQTWDNITRKYIDLWRGKI